MDWLKRLIGGLTGEPKGHTGGALAPASAQRTQLGLKTVDLPRGVVRLKTGEARAFLKVEGYAAHQRSPEAVRAWLQGYARALNTLPGGAVMFVRSRPGGLEGHLARQRTQTVALATAAPGGALARLAADQLAHARELQATGQVRQTDSYVAVWSPRGDAQAVLAAAEAVRRHLEAVRVMTELVTDTRLLDALAFAWRPGVGVATDGAANTWAQDWNDADGRPVATLSYWPRRAAVTDPPPPTPAPPPASGKVRVREADQTGTRKALPR